LSNRGKVWNLFIKKADGTGSDSLVYQSGQAVRPTDWSSDGRYILFTQVNPNTYADIGIIDLKNNDSSHYLLQSEFNEFNGFFSNNMKWIMYGSNESGKSQVYVQPFEGNGGRRQISNNGGYPLRWSNNDKAIIYVWQNEVFKVDVNASSQNFVVGKPELLFNTADKNIIYLYDATKDVKTFLGGVSNGSAITPPLTYIQNWEGLFSKNE
jgi:Tol biopolymer transport system component